MPSYLFSIFLALLIILGIATLPAYHRKSGFTWWEYLSPIGGILVWMGLGYMDFGSGMSMSNGALEFMLLDALTILVGWVAAFLPVHRKPEFKTYRLGLLNLPVIFALLIRLLMPTLPE